MARKIHRVNFISVPESYDLYEDNSRLQMLSEKKISGNFSDMPIFCYMLMETVRHGYRWYKHVKYPNIALELILDGKRQYHSDNGVQIAESGMLYIVSPGSSVSFSIFGDTYLCISHEEACQRDFPFFLGDFCFDNAGTVMCKYSFL